MNQGFKEILTKIGVSELSKSWIEQNICSILEKIVVKHSSKVALCYEQEQLTYGDFLVQLQSFAQAIKNKAKNKHQPVAIYLDNDIAFITAMFACLANGIPYVPLDTAFPLQRNSDIMQHAQAQFVLTKQKYYEALKERELLLTEEMTGKCDFDFSRNATKDSIAYILYTSGSSGKAKGVFQNQRNLLHDVWQYISSIKLTSHDRCSLLYSPSVSGAIRDIYGTLLSGGTLFIKDLKKTSLTDISSFITQHKITIYHSVPTVFRSFLNVSGVTNFPSVRLVYLAGDRIFSSDFELYKKYFSATAFLYIGIGSTENATIYHQWFLNHETKIEGELVPVGYAVNDRYTKILEDGEIEVTSEFMALGYWNDEELTRQYFQLNSDASRTFKTGDVGKINSYGLLTFCGRKDKQVKIAGYRIEPDEIVSKVLTLQGSGHVAILVRQEKEQFKLAIYVEGIVEELRQKLSVLVPAHMLPSYWYHLDKIPLLPNFKIDIQALKKIDEKFIEQDKIHAGTGNSTEEKLKFLWCKYATIQSFENNDTWSNGGGSSVDAIHLLVDIEKTFSCTFSHQEIHNEMTAQSLLKALRTAVLKAQENKKPVLYFFRWLCGFPKAHQQLAAKLSSVAEVRMIEYPEEKESNMDFKIFCDQIAAKNSFENTEAIFFGVLSGTYFAQEMANRFEQKNKGALLRVIVMDFEAPTVRKSKIKLWYRFVKNVFKKVNESFTNQQKHHIKLLSTARLLKLNSPISVIALNNKRALKGKYLGWDGFTQKVELSSFSFTHLQMSNDDKKLEAVASRLRAVLKISS